MGWYQRRVHGECCGHHTALNMNQIILVVALFGSLVLSEEVVRKPKLFFVSTSATTSTLQTASFCYVTSAAGTPTCTGRKRRAISSLNVVETEEAVEPSEFKKQDEVSSSLLEEAHAVDRKGRFLLYWITTTSISPSTSFTTTFSVSSVSCFPGTVNQCK